MWVLDVSILIPAFRPTFLREAIASALAQSGDDFRILISDDSGGGDLAPIVETFRDPRIHYVRTAGRTGAGENCRNLWRLCETDRMMFLFDDDVLLPYAKAELSAALDAAPQASFAFGRRHVIDAGGRITREAPPNMPSAVVEAPELVTALVGSVTNPIGELSNVMINRACGVTADDLLTYGGLQLEVNADVAFYLNASRHGPAIGVGKPVAAFRLHGAQNSAAAFNPKFPFGAVEWELFVRGEHDAGRLPQAAALKAVEKLTGAYEAWSKNHPDVALMAPGLDRLAARIRQGETGTLDDAFRADWARFAAAVQARGQPAPATT